MAKQDKRLKKDKAAKKKADEIVEKAIKKVKKAPKHKPESVTVEYPAKWDEERIDGVSDEAWVLAVRVRMLREQGEPWWAVARDLELEGYGQSATTGKKGAGRARAAYKAGFGSFPRTFQRGAYKGPAEVNERVKELKARKIKERKAIAKAGKSVIDPKATDEEIANMLKGRKIRWFSTELVKDGIDYEACVHPKAEFYVYEENGERVVQFREEHRRASVADRWHPAQTRTVRVRQIYSVK